jgi:hypothetical protein
VTPPWKALVGSVTAKTTTTSATGPLEMKVLLPLRRQPRTAALGAQAHGEGVRTRIGFGDGVRTDQCAVAQAAQVAVLLRSLPCCQTGTTQARTWAQIENTRPPSRQP